MAYTPSYSGSCSGYNSRTVDNWQPPGTVTPGSVNRLGGDSARAFSMDGTPGGTPSLWQKGSSASGKKQTLSQTAAEEHLSSGVCSAASFNADQQQVRRFIAKEMTNLSYFHEQVREIIDRFLQEVEIASKALQSFNSEVVSRMHVASAEESERNRVIMEYFQLAQSVRKSLCFDALDAVDKGSKITFDETKALIGLIFFAREQQVQLLGKHLTVLQEQDTHTLQLELERQKAFLSADSQLFSQMKEIAAQDMQYQVVTQELSLKERQAKHQMRMDEKRDETQKDQIAHQKKMDELQLQLGLRAIEIATETDRMRMQLNAQVEREKTNLLGQVEMQRTMIGAQVQIHGQNKQAETAIHRQNREAETRMYEFAKKAETEMFKSSQETQVGLANAEANAIRARGYATGQERGGTARIIEAGKPSCAIL